MPKIKITDDARAEDLAPLALTLNELIHLPVTLRSQEAPGVRVEDGRVVDSNYTGPVLEEVLKTGRPMRTVPSSGAYVGVPVSVAPLVVEGHTIAAIGVVDVIGTVDLPEIFGAYTRVVKQVSEHR
ncbi:MAG: DUF2111 domain-containing protein [Methanosarcinales archaeon]|nr:DUF2111 domain-containing protein [Methanosarcinales archaeon]